MKKFILAATIAASTAAVLNAAEVVKQEVVTVGPVTVTKAVAPTQSFLNNPNFQVVKEHQISPNLKGVNLNVKIMSKQGPQSKKVKAFAAQIDGKEYVITGTIYDPVGKILSVPTDIDAPTLKAGISWTMGSGNKEVYLVTNPSCPWCEKFEVQAHNSNFLKNHKVNVILMPFHPNANEKAQWVLSAASDAERAKRYTDLMVNKDNSWRNFKPDAAEATRLNALINKGNAAAKAIGASGTPALFDASYSKIENWPALMK